MGYIFPIGGSEDDDTSDSTTDSTSDSTTDAGPGSVDLDSTPNDPGIPDWVLTPSVFASKVRGVIYGDFLAGLAKVIAPIFTAISILFLGTNPSTFAAEGEQFGIADLPVYLFEILGNATSVPIQSWFGALQSIVIAAVPETDGPIEGLAVIFVAVVVLFVFFELARRVFWAIIDSIPILSGLIGGG